jgi:DNA polymerase III epsilon subunit-like protein
MTKIDHRHNYYIVLDTETANTSGANGGVDATSALVYDLGFAVIDSKGRVYETFSFINSDVFFKMQDVMTSAYYADKIPLYIEGISNGDYEVKTWFEIRSKLAETCDLYSPNAIIAHNAYFDYKSATATQRYLTKSKYRFFFPFDIPIWDSLKMARATIGKSEDYKEFCEENGFLTKHKTPRPRLTAEILYRYLTNDMDYKEEHTGLADVMIEKEIFLKCLEMATLKNLPKELFGERR